MRYEIRPLDEDGDMLMDADELLATADDAAKAKALANDLSNTTFGVGILDKTTGEKDFGFGFGAGYPSPDQ